MAKALIPQVKPGSFPECKLSADDWQNAFNSLKPELRDKIKQIRSCLIDETVSILRRRYKVGRDVIELTNKTNKYGQHAVEKMSQLIGIDTGTLYNMKLFAERYTDEQLDELIDANLKHPRSAITWTHVAHLIRIDNVEERDALQKRILDEQMTVQELVDVRQAQLNRPVSSTPAPVARAAPKPKDFNGYLTQFESMASKLLKSYKEVWFGPNDGLSEASRDVDNTAVDTTLINRLLDDVELANNLSMAMSNYSNELESIIKIFERCSKQSKTEEPVEA